MTQTPDWDDEVVDLFAVVRAAPGKELEVAAALGLMGFDAVVPLEATSRRVHPLSKRQKVEYRPATPRTLFAAQTVAAGGVLDGVRYACGLRRDFAAQPLLIPSGQVSRFMDALAEYNAELEVFARGKSGAQPPKREWLEMTPDALMACKEQLFGSREAA